MATKKFLDYEGLQELVLKIKEYVGDAGKIEFKGVVADVAHLPTLADQKVGWMYTVSAEGLTTSDFVEGSGLKVAANSEVACVEIDVSGTLTKKWCLLGPVFDVDDKLTFTTTTMPAGVDGEIVMYLGETTYVYNEVTPEVGDDPAALGWYHSDDDGETWSAATEHEADTATYIYATKDEQYVQGVVYQYVAAQSKYVPLSSGDTFIPITTGEIDALFA